MYIKVFLKNWWDWGIKRCIFQCKTFEAMHRFLPQNSSMMTQYRTNWDRCSVYYTEEFITELDWLCAHSSTFQDSEKINAHCTLTSLYNLSLTADLWIITTATNMIAARLHYHLDNVQTPWVGNDFSLQTSKCEAVKNGIRDNVGKNQTIPNFQLKFCVVKNYYC